MGLTCSKQEHVTVNLLRSVQNVSCVVQQTHKITLFSSPLQNAMDRHDVQRVIELIHSGADCADVFMCAIRWHNLELIRLLLDLPLNRGVNPAANENAALLFACEFGLLEIARLLLDLPLNRGVNPSGCLVVSVKSVRIEIVRLLLERERGASANILQALQLAVRTGSSAITHLLLQHLKNNSMYDIFNESMEREMLHAKLSEHWVIIGMLMLHRPPTPPKNEPPPPPLTLREIAAALLAIQEMPCCTQYVDAFAKVQAKFRQQCETASVILDGVLERDAACIDEDGTMKKMLDDLHTRVAEIEFELTMRNSNNFDTLKLACRNGHVNIVRLLLDELATCGFANTIDEFMYQAILGGQTEIVRLILGYRCSMKLDVALRCACTHGQTEIVRLLLETPARSSVNNATLRCACESKNLDCIRLLIDHTMARRLVI